MTSSVGGGYEYLEHTADIQIHSWGNTVIESFTQCSYALYDYMTNRESVKEDKDYTTIVIVEGDSVEGLLYNFLDELLFRFSSEPFFVAKRIVINSLDLNNYQLSATCYGEPFRPGQHPCGTEVKAITKSNLQVGTHQAPYHIYIILDI